MDILDGFQKLVSTVETPRLKFFTSFEYDLWVDRESPGYRDLNYKKNSAQNKK